MSKTPKSDAEILLERVAQILTSKEKSEYWLNSQITGGGTTKVITEIRRKGVIPKTARMLKMAEILDTTPEYLLGQTDEPKQTRSEVSVSDTHIEWRGPEPKDPGIPLMGTGDCADIELLDSAGETIEIARSSFDPDYPVRMIARPPALRGAADLYAIYFHGDSMFPRFNPGEVGIVDPRRPVIAGDDVLVQLNNGEEDDVITVLVKRLVSQNSKAITLRQFNPDVTFDVPRDRVSRMHRIMPQTDLLFG